MTHLWQGVARRLVPVLIAPLLLAGGSSLQAQPEGKPPGVPRELAPLQCWWRTSTPSVRIAEPFTVLLTCAVAGSGPQDVILDQGTLEPEAIQLAPFEVLSGSRTEFRADGRRFIQREYRLRILSDAAFGRDVRRLRPNILIGGVDGLDERTWPGSLLHIGEVVIRIDSLRSRCPITTVDPDTLDRDPEVLKDIGRRFGGRIALNAEVLRGGRVSVGDSVRLIKSTP